MAGKLARSPLLALREKVSPKATDEGCSRERQRLTSLEHPSSVSALRADPPSPARGEGKERPHRWPFTRPPHHANPPFMA
ncbi:MAG: hypothetical protein E5Y12_26295, partial [Mesorhizobium sp.]